MNKRMTYLLATLLIAESALPLSAQSLDGQARTHSAINTNYSRTTSGGITITPPTTTGPAITVKIDKIYATEIADARAKIDFQLHNVELKPKYTEQAASLHIALEANMALSSISSTGEVTNEIIENPGVVTIHNSKNFTFDFTAKNINPDSIKGNSYFIFKIPGYLLTTDSDLEVKVFIEHDLVSQPILSVNSTTSPDAKIVTLNCDTKYSNIRYTLDGSDVTLASTLYDGTPITVNSSDILKATAFVGTMPSEQFVVDYNNIPSYEDSNSSGTTDSEAGSSNSNGTTDSEGGNSGSNGTTDSEGGNSGSNGTTDSEDGNSNSNGTTNSGAGSSSSDKDTDHSTEIDSSTNTDSTTSTTENSDQSTSDITSIPDTISNTVATLIQQKERYLNTKATEVQYGLTINNQKVELEHKLLMRNGITLAPLRTIAQALNIPIHYHAESKTAIIKTEDKLIEFPLGYNVAIINGEMVQIAANDSTVMSTIQHGRTYLPLRFIAEQLNLNIYFDGEQVHMSSLK